MCVFRAGAAAVAGLALSAVAAMAVDAGEPDFEGRYAGAEVGVLLRDSGRDNGAEVLDRVGDPVVVRLRRAAGGGRDVMLYGVVTLRAASSVDGSYGLGDPVVESPADVCAEHFRDEVAGWLDDAVGSGGTRLEAGVLAHVPTLTGEPAPRTPRLGMVRVAPAEGGEPPAGELRPGESLAVGLVRAGLTRVWTWGLDWVPSPPTRAMRAELERLRAAQVEARAEGRGLWNVLPPPGLEGERVRVRNLDYERRLSWARRHCSWGVEWAYERSKQVFRYLLGEE